MGRGALCALLLACAAAAAGEPTREVPIAFDARQWQVRPMVHATIGGRPAALLLDTGAPEHLVGLKLAHALGPLGGAPRSFVDAYGRAYPIWPLDVAIAIAGWGTVEPSPLHAGNLPDRGRARALGAPHFDGLLSPQQLPRPGAAVVLDFTTSTLRETSWDDALARLRACCDRTLTNGVGALAGDEHFVVAAQVAGRELALIVDTGAPSTLLYEARGEDLPPQAVRLRTRRAGIRVGEVDTWSSIELLEALPAERAPLYDGLLGMDVLRACALALDRTRLVVRCRSEELR
jgi:hypothetical protein